MKIADFLHREHTRGQGLPRPSIPLARPHPVNFDQARNLLHQDSIFMEDAGPASDFDLLSEEEKAELTSLFEHGQRDHKRRVFNALDAHFRTGDIDEIDRAIALLLHQRLIQHPND